MAEIKGYTCDGGCGNSTILDDCRSVQSHGWFTIFTPSGLPILEACSVECVVQAMQGLCVGGDTDG